MLGKQISKSTGPQGHHSLMAEKVQKKAYNKIIKETNAVTTRANAVTTGTRRRAHNPGYWNSKGFLEEESLKSIYSDN